MKSAVHTGLLLVVLSTFAQDVHKADAVRVPDVATALKIAEPILVRTYGKRQIDSERPLSAELVGGVWITHGSLCCSDGAGRKTCEPGRCVGGVAQLKLRQKDGKVLSITHGK